MNPTMLPIARTFLLPTCLLSLPVASAATVPIINGDFESPDFDTNNHPTVEGWIEEVAGSAYLGDQAPQWGPVDMTQIGYFANTDGTAIHQDIGHEWSWTDEFTLTIDAFDAGWRVAAEGDVLGVELRQSDGTVLWDSGPLNVDGTVEGVENGFAWSAANRHLSFVFHGARDFDTGRPRNPLNLRIYRQSGVVFFDNVALEVATVVHDSDGDGLDDYWEDKFFGDDDGDPTEEELMRQDGDDDGYPVADGDGLGNLAEQTANTDPNSPDSDGDGISDRDELNGTLNVAFSNQGTNPLRADTDGDGAPDGAEITGSLNAAFGHAPTDPNAGDTDGDGMLDGYELANDEEGSALDPNDDGSTDPGQAPEGDRDGDTISNIEEHDGFPYGVQTRADRADTDGDGYDDLAEDMYGSWGSGEGTGTNPAVADTDGDGLLDGEENPDTGTPGGAPYNSDPNFADTDLDGFDDGIEVDQGTDPNSAASSPTQPSGFSLVEDFEGMDMTVGATFDGVNGWVAEPTVSTVELEPVAGAEQVARIGGAGVAHATYRSLEDQLLQILEGNTGTLFLQCYAGPGVGIAMALTDEADPSEPLYAVPEAGVNLVTDAVGRPSFSSFGAPAALVAAEAPTLSGSWYNLWIVADNEADTCEIHARAAGETGAPLQLTWDDGGTPNGTFSFRNLSSEALRTFLALAFVETTSGEAFYIDNLCVDPTARNLTLPVVDKPAGGSNSPRIVSSGFVGDDFQVVVEGLDPAGTYVLRRGAAPVAFDELIETVSQPTDPQIFTDADALGEQPRAFYRIEDAP